MKLKLAFLFSLIAVGIHVYLALHFYNLNFGISSGESICNLSTQFNCDTVTASRFSAVFGIPIAAFGATANLILAILLAGWVFGWSENLQRHGKYSLFLSALIASTSIVMGTISTFYIQSFCIFCIGTYLISFLVLGLIASEQEPDSRPMTYYLPQIFSSAKIYLALFAAIPLGATFSHKVFTKQIGADRINIIIRNSVAEWQSNPQVDFSTVKASMATGPDNAKMIIKEFADFRCSHCKQASPGLKAFFRSHQDVRIEFYVFPLDGTCNDAIEGGGGDGISCYLAKNTYCAELTAKKGWEMHDYYFSIQEEINNSPSIEFAREKTSAAITLMGLTAENQKSCVESAETDTAIRAQAKLGKESGVKGTPTIFVNGRKLPYAQMVPVLEAAYNTQLK